MPKDELLPGVRTSSCPPLVRCDAHTEIRIARRNAFLRDALQIVMLLAVDALFLYWPESRIPFLDRAMSITFLMGVHAAIAADLWLTRAWPRWMARRVASTWSRTERDRFVCERQRSA